MAQDSAFIHLNLIKTINGSPVANGSHILRDKYGFTWLVTQEGLFRYDGLNSFYYGKNTGNTLYDLPNNNINRIAFSDDGNYLWVINSFNGISKINLSTGYIVKYLAFPTNTKTSGDNDIRGQTVIGKNLYFSFENGMIGKLDQTNDSISYTDLNTPIISFGRVNNYFYCITGRYQLLFMDSSFKQVGTPLSITSYQADNRLQANICLNDTTTILSLGKKLVKITFYKAGRMFQVEAIAPLPLSFSNIYSIQSIDNLLYIGLEDKLISYNLKTNSYTRFIAEKLDEQKWLMGALAVKKLDNELWIGNELGITTTEVGKTRNAFTTMPSGTVKLNHCYGVTKISDSSLFINTTDGLFTTNLRSHTVRKIDNRYHIYTTQAPDNFYISSHTSGSLFWKQQPEIRMPSSPSAGAILNSLKDDIFISSAHLEDSLFFFASLVKKGLIIYNVRQNFLSFIGGQTKPQCLKNTDINRLFVNNDQQLLIVCTNTISILDPITGKLTDKQITDPATHKPMTVLNDILQIGNRYYLAVYGVGIVETDTSFQLLNIFNKKNGIDNINLYKIFNQGDSLIITSSNNGLFVLNLKSRHVSKYYERDGLHGNGFEQFSGCRLNDSMIAVGGIDGFTVVNTRLLTTNSSRPLLYFNKITIETDKGRFDTSNLLIKQIAIPDNALQTTIYLSGINYRNPERVTFTWKLEKKSGEWVEIGTRSFITFVGLSPGTYHLQVRAANEDGIYSGIKELTLTVLPKWYQSWWFLLLIVLAVCTALYLLYTYRLQQLKKQHEIRKNIAADLHDDLGSTLNSIKIFTGLAIKGINQYENLQIINTSLSEASLSLRDLLWVLDDTLDSIEHFVTRLKQYVTPITLVNQIKTEFIFDDVNSHLQLSKDEKRNLYLVCKEAVNNCVKYAKATELKLTFSQADNKLLIVIQDNGQGFDVEKSSGGGYGLKNMAYRMKKIDFLIHIQSSPGKGTMIRISHK